MPNLVWSLFASLPIFNFRFFSKSLKQHSPYWHKDPVRSGGHWQVNPFPRWVSIHWPLLQGLFEQSPSAEINVLLSIIDNIFSRTYDTYSIFGCTFCQTNRGDKCSESRQGVPVGISSHLCRGCLSDRHFVWFHSVVRCSREGTSICTSSPHRYRSPRFYRDLVRTRWHLKLGLEILVEIFLNRPLKSLRYRVAIWSARIQITVYDTRMPKR